MTQNINKRQYPTDKLTKRSTKEETSVKSEENGVSIRMTREIYKHLDK